METTQCSCKRMGLIAWPLALMLPLPVAAHADTTAFLNAELADAAIAHDHELDRVRGGFLIPGGLEINIGFAKIGVIDGVVQYRHVFNMPSMPKMPKMPKMPNLSATLDLPTPSVPGAVTSAPDDSPPSPDNGLNAAAPANLANGPGPDSTPVIPGQLANSGVPDTPTMPDPANGSDTAGIPGSADVTVSTPAAPASDDLAITLTHLPQQIRTVIQNSLDSRTIQDLTILNVEVSNMRNLHRSVPSQLNMELNYFLR